MAKKDFPKDFFWGSAAAAHQVEGENRHNQWWEFEQSPGNIKKGMKSGMACDHYNRFEEDFKLLKENNQNCHRLSIEWSRFYPNSPDELNQEAVKHYHKVIDKLIELNLEPFITTLHFSIPTWFANIGGFEKEKNIKYYISFVKLLANEYGKKIRYWNTINEPGIYSMASYFSGEFPPGQKNPLLAFKVLKNSLLAHSKAYKAIKEIAPEAKVGLVKNIAVFQSYNPKNPINRVITKIIDFIFNEAPLRSLKTGIINFPLSLWRKDKDLINSTDFLGLNYYVRVYISLDLKTHFIKNKDEYTTQMGWAVYPEGLHESIMRLHNKFKLPIYITENGIATDNDNERINYIKSHLNEVHRAIEDGAKVKGYFYWSNLDNFEWAHGYAPKFGLIKVEKDFSRTPKESLKYYGKIAENGCLEVD